MSYTIKAALATVILGLGAGVPLSTGYAAVIPLLCEGMVMDCVGTNTGGRDASVSYTLDTGVRILDSGKSMQRKPVMHKLTVLNDSQIVGNWANTSGTEHGTASATDKVTINRLNGAWWNHAVINVNMSDGTPKRIVLTLTGKCKAAPTKKF